MSDSEQRRRPIGATKIRDEHGRKQCRECLRWLSVDSFAKVKNNADGLATLCQKCKVKYDRETGVKFRYGLSWDEYIEAIEMQGGECPICALPLDPALAVVDHDHACCPGTRTCGKCVRGILHSRCNSALGMLKDSVDNAQRAATYLRKNHDR